MDISKNAGCHHLLLLHDTYFQLNLFVIYLISHVIDDRFLLYIHLKFNNKSSRRWVDNYFSQLIKLNN